MTFVIAAALAAVAGTHVSDVLWRGHVLRRLRSRREGIHCRGSRRDWLLPGAVIGGLLIGLIETLWSAYFSIDYKDVAAFSVLAVTLIFLPLGPVRPAGRRKGVKIGGLSPNPTAAMPTPCLRCRPASRWRSRYAMPALPRRSPLACFSLIGFQTVTDISQQIWCCRRGGRCCSRSSRFIGTAASAFRC